MTLIALIYDFVTIQGTIWVYNLIAGFSCHTYAFVLYYLWYV
jgi:hypothetical protein